MTPDASPAGYLSIPIWVFLLVLSVGGSALTVAAVFIMRFTKLAATAQSLAESASKLTNKVDALEKTVIELQKDLAFMQQLRSEDREREREERQRVPTPVAGVEYLDAERHATPAPFRPKK